MDLPPEAVFFPIEDGPYRMQMGLVARDPADLIAIDARGRNLLPARDPFAAALRANAGNVEAVMAAPAALN